MRTVRARRPLGLGLAVVLIAASCSSGDADGATSTTTESTDASRTSGTGTQTDPLDLEDGDTITFEVKVVLADDPSSPLWAPNCYTLSADGTFNDPGFPSPEAPIAGTWENGWDGSSSSYVAEAAGAGLTLTQTGQITVDEDTGEVSLAAESDVALDGETVATAISVGKVVDSCTPVPG